MHLLAHGFHHLVHAIRHTTHPVAVTAGHANHLAGGENRRSLEPAFVAGIANGKLLVFATPTVADGRDAAQERVSGVLKGSQDGVGRIELLEGGPRVGLATKHEMHMAVDEAGHDGPARAVHDFAGEAFKVSGRRNAGDAVAIDQHAVAVDHPIAIEDPTVEVEATRGHAPTGNPTNWCVRPSCPCSAE